MMRSTSLAMILTTSVALGACSGGDKATSDTATETTSGTTTGGSGSTAANTETGTDTSTTGEMTSTSGADTAADGEPCTANGDCQSQSCLKFTDNDPDAACSAAPEGGNTRITGTIFDFVSGASLGDAELRVIGALSALQNPSMATPLMTGTSGADGKVDMTSAEPLSAGIGIVGIVVANGYYLTATGLASPVSGSSYGPLNSIHDIWAMPSDELTKWSTILMDDAEIAPYLPLGDEGGVVGMVRSAASSAPIAGAKVVPEGGSTNALIRYLNDAGDGFTSDMTGASGIFVLVNPGLAEKFNVEVDGNVVADTEGTAGSAKGAAFIMLLNVK